MKTRTVVVAVLIIAAVGFMGWRSRSSSTGVEVAAATVDRVPLLQSQVTASGEIVASRFAEIGANVMGRIVSLSVREGDVVRAGQVLARIDSAQAASAAEGADAALGALQADARAAATQVRSAQAAFAEARSRATEATAALDRARQLRDAGLLPASDFDKAVASEAAATAQVASTGAAVERAQQTAAATERRVAQGGAERARARDQLSKTDVTAPIDGVVTRLNVEAGEMVVIGIQNQPGTTLMTVSDLSEINAEVKVAEADVMRLKAGLPATVSLEALPGQTFPGRVVEIGASALPQIGAQATAREFRVKVRLDNTATPLKPGLTCDADIIAVERKNVLTVPLPAVVERNGKTGVFTISDGTAKFMPVTTGIIGGLSIEIDGIPEGTSIIAGPIQTLRDLADGTMVRVTTDRR